MPHAVIAGPIHAAGVALLKGRGWRCTHFTEESPDAYLAALPEADALLIRTQSLTAEAIASAPGLRIVSRHGVGYDAVDREALAARRIPLAVVGDVNSRTVAEHAMMLLLAAARRALRSDRAVRAGDWAYRNSLAPRELYARTLLIVGYGRIGRHLAAMAAGFGMRIVAFDPYLEAGDFEGVVRAETLKDALADADFVSLHLPKGGETVLDAAAIARMKPGAVVVNTARGGLIDEAALAEALRSGHLGAAGLDVFETEPPPPDHPLLDCDTAILTPHSASLTADCAERMALRSAQSILDHFDGRLDPGLVVTPPG